MRVHHGAGRGDGCMLCAWPDKVEGPGIRRSQRNKHRAIESEIQFAISTLLKFSPSRSIYLLLFRGWGRTIRRRRILKYNDWVRQVGAFGEVGIHADKSCQRCAGVSGENGQIAHFPGRQIQVAGRDQSGNSIHPVLTKAHFEKLRRRQNGIFTGKSVHEGDLKMANIVYRLAEFDFDGSAQMTINHCQPAEDEIAGAAEDCLLGTPHIQRTDSVTEVAGSSAQGEYLFEPRWKL